MHAFENFQPNPPRSEFSSSTRELNWVWKRCFISWMSSSRLSTRSFLSPKSSRARSCWALRACRPNKFQFQNLERSPSADLFQKPFAPEPKCLWRTELESNKDGNTFDSEGQTQGFTSWLLFGKEQVYQLIGFTYHLALTCKAFWAWVNLFASLWYCSARLHVLKSSSWASSARISALETRFWSNSMSLAFSSLCPLMTPFFCELLATVSESPGLQGSTFFNESAGHQAPAKRLWQIH